MSGIKGKAHRGRTDDIVNGEGRDTPKEFVTAQPAGHSRVALDTITLGVAYITQAANPEALSTARKIVATGHLARRGDIVRILTSANGIQELEIAVDSVSANEIILTGDATDAAGASAVFDAADTYDILRPTTLRTAADGGIATGPVSFILDGSSTQVIEDTVTPANNAPLPVKITSATGDINITAGDLNVQTSHTGATPDSTQVGDGTEIMLISAAGEAQVHDTAARASLASLDAKFVGGTDIGDVTVNNAAGAAAVNIQDGGNSITVDDGGTTLSVDAVNLDIRDLAHASDSVAIGDGVETVNVNASNELQVRDDDANTSLTNINSKFASLGQKANAASAPVTISTEQEAILAGIQTAVELIDNTVNGSSQLNIRIDDLNGVATEATLNSQSAKLPASLGAKATAASLSVTMSTDEAPLAIAVPTSVSFGRLDFSSTNVVSGAYVTLLADSGLAGTKISIFVASGDPMYLAIGAAAAEVDHILIPPGGFAHLMEIAIPANSRLSLKRFLAGSTTAGQIIINIMG